MRKSFGINACIALCVTVLGACSDDPRRGGNGESCTSADDCNNGLACIRQVCTRPNHDAGTASEDDAGVGSAGTSCSARRDCGEGFSCIANACQSMSVGMTAGTRYSGRGESCLATNDCEPDLACMMGTCRQDGSALPLLKKSCYRVECANKQDCCEGFTPNANCEMYKANCMTDPIFCNTYRSLCECSQDCIDEQCVAGTPGCASNGECTSMQTPFCVQGKCRQCDQKSACPGGDASCVDGVCMASCTTDENCPLLFKCQDSACIETGCTSDRECAFITKNGQATCHAGKCGAPCNADADCTADKASTGFEVCEQGQCVFVGCESDTECRALFGLAGQRNKSRAVCR
jgi:hypothetical protein